MPDAVAPDGSDIYFRVLDAQRASVVEVVLGPGRTSRPVKHKTVEEIWYVLAGTGEVWVAGATRSVTPGDAVVIPTGSAFQFRADGEEPLRFLCYTSPPWPGDGEAVLVEEGGLGEPSV
ncbi:MAG TPA: cupin domain-containing protein [Candidatus Dormibacteraeota bacterium]|nr:cupin domain-containing protein [Candidatus Dormibacteraeota bacterium]